VRKNGGIYPENLILIKTYREQSTARESWKEAWTRQWNSFETTITTVSRTIFSTVLRP